MSGLISVCTQCIGEAEQGNAMDTRQESNRTKMCKKENIRTLGVTL